VGDDFIREGIRAVLDRVLPGYRPLFINKHDPASIAEPREGEAAKARDKYRESALFIQSGAPVYWHLKNGAHRSVDAEWHSWLWRDRVLSDTGPHPVFLNLGAGSTQPWGDDGSSFVNDPACAAFARAIGARAALTTVRDPLAASMLARLGVKHELIACPAFLAAARQPAGGEHEGVIGVNLMRKGGHFSIDPELNAAKWAAACRQLVGGLRKRAKLRFICHDAPEAEWARKLAAPGEEVFLSPSWEAYLGAYRRCAAVVANRVHGAVGAAGFGVPSVIIGNDSRAQIGEAMRLPIFRAATVKPTEVVVRVERLLQQRAREQKRLLALREAVLGQYVQRLAPVLEPLAGEPEAARPRVRILRRRARAPR
jgi:hypothetical protein